MDDGDDMESDFLNLMPNMAAESNFGSRGQVIQDKPREQKQLAQVSDIQEHP